MKKNVLSRILIACLALVMLFGMVGCAGTKPTEPKTDKETVTLTIWLQSMLGSAEMLLEENERYINTAVARFQEKYPHIKFEIVKTNGGGESAAMWKAGALAKAAPDIAEFWSGDTMTSLAEYAYPIYDLLSEETKKNLGSWDTVTVPGETKPMALPTPFGTLSGIYYNKEIVKKAGLDFENNAPRTIEEFFAACDKIKAAGYTPIIADEASVGYLQAYLCKFWYNQACSETEIRDMMAGKTKFSENADFLKALETYQQLYSKGYVNQDTMSASDWEARWLSGTEAAMTPSASHKAAAFSDGLGKDNVGFMKIPNLLPEAECNNYDKMLGGAGQGLIVSKDTKHPEEVALFLDFLCSPAEWEIYFNMKTNSIPNVAGVDTSKLTDKIPVMTTLAALAVDKIGYCNYETPDVSEAMDRYIDDMLVGKMTPMEVAKALDGVAALAAGA